MTDQERLGRLDDQEEAAEQPSKTDGPSAAGEYDPAEGSPGHPHPTAPEGSEAVTRHDTGTDTGTVTGTVTGTDPDGDAVGGSGAGDGGTGS